MNDRTRGLIGRIDATGLPLLAARAVLGLDLMYLGIKKIGDPVTFLKLIRQYHMLPEDPAVYLNSVALILPWMETICGAALILGLAVRGAGLISAGMLGVFTPMIYWRGMELFREGAAATFCGVNFDCGCGSGEVFVCSKLATNAGLFLLTLIVVFSRSRRLCLSQAFKSRASA